MRTISKNQLIISRNDEHGAAIISAWKSIGVNTSLHGNGVACKYYGYIDGKFDNYSERQIKYKQYEIIDLNHEIFNSNNLDKIITAEQGQQIINIACKYWAEKLAEKWGTNIVLANSINIKYDDYKTMRKACTRNQDKLFDDIFGPEKPKFEINDYVVWSGLGESITGKLIDGISPYWTIDFKHTIETYNANLSLLHINENSFRLATNPEIILEREKTPYIPHPEKNTPWLIRRDETIPWMLFYADGNGSYYSSGKKSGPSVNVNLYKYVTPFNSNLIIPE